MAAGVLLLGKLLTLLVLIASAFVAFVVCFVVNDIIWKIIRIKKERRGNRNKQRAVP